VLARRSSGRRLGCRVKSEQPRTAQDVQALVEERQIRFIRFWFTDILGQLKSFSTADRNSRSASAYFFLA